MGQSAPFWRCPQFDLFICINIWKKLPVCNKRYVKYILTEYHMRSDMSAENRLLIAALKMSQILPCGAKRPAGLWSHITISSESLEYILIADTIVYYIVCVLVIAVNCNHRGPISHGPCCLPTVHVAECVAFNARKLTSTTALTFQPTGALSAMSLHLESAPNIR